MIIPALVSFHWHTRHRRYLHWVSWRDLCHVSLQPHSSLPRRSEYQIRDSNIITDYLKMKVTT